MGFGERTPVTIRASGGFTSCWHNQYSEPVRIHILLWISGHHFWSNLANAHFRLAKNCPFVILQIIHETNSKRFRSFAIVQVMPNNYIASITLYCNTSFPTILPYNNSCGKAYKYLYNRTNSQGSCSDTTAAWHKPQTLYEIPPCNKINSNNNKHRNKHTNIVSG